MVKNAITPTNTKQIQTHMDNGGKVFYQDLVIEEVKTTWGHVRVRTKDSDLFFKPWLPAVRLS